MNREIPSPRLPAQAFAPSTPVVPLADVSGTAGDDSLQGSVAGGDRLSGLAGNDTLNGDEGQNGFAYANDTLLGGAGDDTLIDSFYKNVDFARPYTFAIDGGAGKDYAIIKLHWLGSTRFAVADNIDGVVTLGYRTTITRVERVDISASSSADSIAGGAFPDTLRGNSGDDSLFGMGGDDLLVGGFDDDLVHGGGGDDSLDGGDSADELNGSAGNDTISGGWGRDVLAGGLGEDRLRGGRGADTYVFATQPSPQNIDRIVGFDPHADQLQLDPTVFTALTAGAALDAAQWHAAPGATAAHDADDRIVYDTNTGRLYYDADGDGGGAEPIQFALLFARPELTAADVSVGS